MSDDRAGMVAAAIDLPEDLAEQLEATRAGGPIGHSTAAHTVHGWCALCERRTVIDEVYAWRNLVQVEAAITSPARPGGSGGGRTAATVVLDFDGPLHDYRQGWGDGTVYGGPTDGSAEALAELMAGFAVVIGTARPNLGEVAAAIRRWYGVQTVLDTPSGRCQFWAVRGAVLVTGRKLPAVAYIDDRAIRWVAPDAEHGVSVTVPGRGWGYALKEFNDRHGHLAAPGPAPFLALHGESGDPL